MSAADGVYETSDLGASAWFSMLWTQSHGSDGLELLGAGRDAGPEGRKGRFRFRFRDPEGRGRELEVRYVSTCCASHDASVRNLRKMVS